MVSLLVVTPGICSLLSWKIIHDTRIFMHIVVSGFVGCEDYHIHMRICLSLDPSVAMIVTSNETTIL